MVLNYILSGQGQPIVFLHGLASSLRSWQPFIDELDPKKYQFLSIDLLGFGHSPKPKNVTYSYENHVASLVETIKAAGIKEPFILVGHSMGGLLALRLSAENPGLAKKIIIYGLPFFPTPEISRHEITHGRLIKRLAYYGPTSHILCNLWCQAFKPISKRLAHMYLPNLTREVAEDSVLHYWQSFSESLKNIVENHHVRQDLEKLKIPVKLVYGSEDSCKNYIESENLLDGLNHVEVSIKKGLNHNLPYLQPEIINSLV